MTVPQAIKFLIEDYEQVDPSYAESPLMEWCQPMSQDELEKWLMTPQPEDGELEYGTEEWVAMLEKTEVPTCAGRILIDWIRAKVKGLWDAYQSEMYEEANVQYPTSGNA